MDLFAGQSLHVDDPLFAVNGGDLALSGLVHAPCDQYLILLTDGHAADVVSGLQFLGQVGRHELASGLRVGTKVGLAVLAAGGSDLTGEFHLDDNLCRKEEVDYEQSRESKENGKTTKDLCEI